MAQRDIFPVRLTDAEKHRLAELASANGQSMSALIRLWIMNAKTPADRLAAG